MIQSIYCSKVKFVLVLFEVKVLFIGLLSSWKSHLSHERQDDVSIHWELCVSVSNVVR